MTEYDGDGNDETLIAGAERFDFSALAHFDPLSVPVITMTLSGVIVAGRGEAPLSVALGESCGDPDCRYRARALTLHESRHALLSSYAFQAQKISAPLELVIDELALDVYRVRSAGQVPVANLEHHPIRGQLGFTAERLAGRPIASPEWQLVRILRDLRGTPAIRLAGAPGAQRLILHADLAGELSIERLGPLREALPIVPANLGSGGMAASIARRLRRSTD